MPAIGVTIRSLFQLHRPLDDMKLPRLDELPLTADLPDASRSIS
jgi:hypothetical protein